MDEQKSTDPQEQEENIDDLEVPDEEGDAVTGGIGAGVPENPTESVT